MGGQGAAGKHKGRGARRHAAGLLMRPPTAVAAGIGEGTCLSGYMYVVLFSTVRVYKHAVFLMCYWGGGVAVFTSTTTRRPDLGTDARAIIRQQVG